MSKPRPVPPVPMRIRDACARGFEEAIDSMVGLVTRPGDKVSPANQIAAFDKLGKYGLGGRSELLLEAGDIAQIVIRHVRENFKPSDAALSRFKRGLIEEFEEIRNYATEGGDIGESAGGDQDD